MHVPEVSASDCLPADILAPGMMAPEVLEITPDMERELIALAKNHYRRRPSAGAKATDPQMRARAQGRTQLLLNEAFSLLQ